MRGLRNLPTPAPDPDKARRRIHKSHATTRMDSDFESILGIRSITMKPATNFLYLLLTVSSANAGTETVFLEKKGIVAIEAESTDSKLGKWIKKTDVADYSGECHLEFTGNKTISGPPNSPLTYSFKISKPGTYQLTLRARKRLETERDDISNDCFVALKGDFDAGGGAPLKVLKEDTKMFGGAADKWAWTTQLDVNHRKYPAIYDLKEGEIYELTISGRSKNFNIDRILLVHADENLRKVQQANPSESQRESGGMGSAGIRAVTRRSLTNSEGRSIDAELLSKDGDKLTIRVRDKRFDVSISSLSEEDQEFIKDWEP
jgi:hypothetical protein